LPVDVGSRVISMTGRRTQLEHMLTLEARIAARQAAMEALTEDALS
jgi:hypothetical protein